MCVPSSSWKVTFSIRCLSSSFRGASPSLQEPHLCGALLAGAWLTAPCCRGPAPSQQRSKAISGPRAISGQVPVSLPGNSCRISRCQQMPAKSRSAATGAAAGWRWPGTPTLGAGALSAPPPRPAGRCLPRDKALRGSGGALPPAENPHAQLANWSICGCCRTGGTSQRSGTG